jgi:hypothetical protein
MLVVKVMRRRSDSHVPSTLPNPTTIPVIQQDTISSRSSWKLKLPQRSPSDILLTNCSRHLVQKHDFFVCSKCFNRFSGPNELDAHPASSCIKACHRRSCRRHRPQGSQKSSNCECITSSTAQWRELFRLQHPDQDPPELARDSNNFGTTECAIEDLQPEQANNGQHVAQSIEPSNVAEPGQQPSDQLEDFDFDAFLSQPPPMPEPAPQVDPLAQMQVLREKVSLLEQRQSLPNEQEQELEMVLGIVWEALVRSKSTEAQPDTWLWKLVRRFAPKILRTTPPAPLQPHNEPPANPPSFDWSDLGTFPFDFSMTNTSQAGRSTDSGYRSGARGL